MNFISPEPIYARIKEDLSSYFDANLVDDLLFPIWLDRALSKFSMGAYPEDDAVVQIKDYRGCLPPNFYKAKSVDLCTDVSYHEYQLPTALYYQTDCRVTNITDGCEPCYDIPDLSKHYCDPCERPYVVVNKRQGTVLFSYRDVVHLTPATSRAMECCSKEFRRHPGEKNTFDIQGDQISVEFPEGILFISYYATGIANEERLIPDNEYIKDYIENYIKYQLFTKLFNSATDETFNQCFRKMMYYKELADESLANARTMLKLPTKKQVIKNIVNTRHKYDKFNIPNHGRKY